MGIHMAPHLQYKHLVFPHLRLEAVVFPKVSSCGPCARLSGELWRGLAWPPLLDKKACNMCFLWHSNQPLPLAPPSPSQGGLQAETGSLILPWSALQLYPSDKAFCVPSLFRSGVSLSQSWVKPFLLSSVWCLGFSCDLPQRRPSHRRCAIQCDHGWWREDQTGVSHLRPPPPMFSKAGSKMDN